MDTESKPKRVPKRNLLNKVTKKFIPDDQLEDTPARLYRRILNAMGMEPHKWGSYLTRYLEWVVVTKDPEKAKTERQTRKGNIEDTYFHKPTLTLNKFIEGLSILEFEEAVIEVTVKDIHGNIIRVSDKIRMVSKTRKQAIIEATTEEVEDDNT